MSYSTTTLSIVVQYYHGLTTTYVKRRELGVKWLPTLICSLQTPVKISLKHLNFKYISKFNNVWLVKT